MSDYTRSGKVIKASSVFVLLGAFLAGQPSLAASPAEQTATGSNAPDCSWGDATFDDRCAGSSARAEVLMAELAKAARLSKAAALSPRQEPEVIVNVPAHQSTLAGPSEKYRR